jgi:hypothetical protein
LCAARSKEFCSSGFTHADAAGQTANFHRRAAVHGPIKAR